MEGCFTRPDLATLILDWIPFGVEFTWADGSLKVIVIVMTKDAVARSWYITCTVLKERKKQNILTRRSAEEFEVAMVLFDSQKFNFPTCLQQITRLWGTIRKLRHLIILLHLHHEKCLEELAEWVVQICFCYTGPPFGVNIDMPLGLYALAPRSRMGFKMHRLEHAPLSFYDVVRRLVNRGIVIDSVHYLTQHWHRTNDRLELTVSGFQPLQL